jgi:FtsH-binding integral membrane protein
VSSNVFAQFGQGMTAFAAPLDARLAFIRRTYAHLAGAVAAFVGFLYAFHVSGVGQAIAEWAFLTPGGGMRWLAVIGGMMVVAWLAQSMAHGAKSTGAQYAGLALYSLGQALVFSPMIWLVAYISTQRGQPSPLAPAAGITLVVFAALTAFVLMTKKDFSFLGMFLGIGGIVALLVIAAGAIFGFSLGLWFIGAMLLFACGAILYTTSRVLHEYRLDQHVGAALELFAAVVMLFWYVLQLLMSLQRRD